MPLKTDTFKVPEIRIKHGWLLQNAFKFYTEKISEYKDIKTPTLEEVKNIEKNRQEIWKTNEKKIIIGMQEISGLHFHQNLIDVYLVFGAQAAFSDPMVLSTKYEGDNFIDVLTHEILHRLLTDNTENIKWFKWIKETYPKHAHDFTAMAHILVHAIHKEIYLTILKSPERLQKDIETCEKWPSYKIAWDIVETEGHLHIITKFKEMYAKQLV
jgi:hypothetical protein